LKDKTVKIEELVDCPNGGIDFLTYNNNYAGKKANRYTYFAYIWGPTKVDGEYKWPLKKYDHDAKKLTKVWGPDGIIAQEPRFVPNPNGTEEDDGIIFTLGYNWKKEETSLFVIDS